MRNKRQRRREGFQSIEAETKWTGDLWGLKP